MFALMAPMFVGGLGLGVETGLWYVDQRTAQNASDAAALAAGAENSSNYSAVANAVAAQYGFQNGVNGVTVSASNTASCPAGGNNCYSVSITMKQQLYLMPVIGFTGNATISGQPAETILASATASAPDLFRTPSLRNSRVCTFSTVFGAIPSTRAVCRIE